MNTVPLLSDTTDWPALLAAERARCEQAEAELAVARAQLTAEASNARRYHTQLVALVKNLPIGLVLVDHKSQIQYVNPYFWELFGLPPAAGPAGGEAPIPAAAVDIAPAFLDPAAFRARVHVLNAAGQTVVQEEFALADGRVVELDYLVLDDADAGRLICYRNVTERHQRGQQLTAQRTFYEAILEQLPVAVAVFDAQHRYLYVNPRVEPDPAVRAWMIGKSNEESCAHRQRPASTARRRSKLFAKVVRKQREVSWEETREAPSGERNLKMRFRPVMAPDGALRWMIASAIDITEWKQAEEKAARQQDFYESILNLLPVDIAVFDAEHRFLFVNPTAISDPAVRRQVIGLTSQEYFARRPQQPAGVAEQREQYFALAVRNRTDVLWEETRPSKELRRSKLILRYLRPIFSADGALRMVVGAGIDITARHVAEEMQRQVQARLQAQQNFIRQIVDTLPNVLYLVEPDGRVSFANTAYEAERRHGRQAANETEPAWTEAQRLQALNDQVRTTRRAVTTETHFMLPAGEVFYYQVHKQPLLRDNGQLGVLTISTDITAVKQARQALERREKQYHDLVYYSQALICTHDLAGMVLSVNPAIERLMGAPAEQLVGHYLGEALLPEHHEGLRAYLKGDKTLRNQARIIAVRTLAGEKRYLQYYTYQVVEAGYPVYVVASGYDITPGVLAQQALEQAKQEAEENSQAKEAFLARMSHEIRTPLNGVLGMAALLKKTNLTATQQEYLNTMQHAGQHLLALLNDVLDMAKITTQHLQLDHGPFDLSLSLQGAGQTVAALAENRGLQLIVEPLAVAAPRVLGDAYRLHQVLLNLLGNAIKFTEQGCVRLGAEVRRDTPEEVTLRFWVADTGVGIAPEQQARIFEAFTQADAETSRRFGGTGLGLSISQQLVSQMGGVLRLCSAPGEGTTFSFQLTLPRVVDLPVAPEPTPAEASFEKLWNLRVLLAEDNTVNQWIAVVVLQHWGVQVDAVGNGVDALAHLSEHDYDAAVLDIRMPGMSGVEVTTAIRQHANPQRASLPIIALTANAFEADRAAYLAAGMNACLTKPYQEADLCQLLLQLTEDRPRVGSEAFR